MQTPVDLYLIFEKSSSTNWIFSLQKSISKLIFAGSKNPVWNRLNIQLAELEFSKLIFQKSSTDQQGVRQERLLNFVQEEAGGPSSTTGSSFSSSSCSTANEWCIWQCHREVKAHWLENQFYSRVRAALPTAQCKFSWNSVWFCENS